MPKYDDKLSQYTASSTLGEIADDVKNKSLGTTPEQMSVRKQMAIQRLTELNRARAAAAAAVAPRAYQDNSGFNATSGLIPARDITIGGSYLHVIKRTTVRGGKPVFVPHIVVCTVVKLNATSPTIKLPDGKKKVVKFDSLYYHKD